MASILPQTQDTIDALKACGLKRNEFQVRCERLMNGSRFCGYGDVKIVLWCAMERQHELVSKLAEHFKVEMWIRDAQPWGPVWVSEAKGKPGLAIRYYEKEYRRNQGCRCD